MDPATLALLAQVSQQVQGKIGSSVASKIRPDEISSKSDIRKASFADAIEAIPLTLAENAGLDPIDTQVELRSKHGQGHIWYGVGVLDGGVIDIYNKGIFEPEIVKEQIIKSATEVSCMILRIDDVIAASKMKEPTKPPMPGGEEGAPYGEY